MLRRRRSLSPSATPAARDGVRYSQVVSAPRIIAHRGDSSSLPENTLAAFYGARDAGADGIEFDVHMTADGHLIVLHDYDLARTTTGSGFVHDRTLDYVRSLSAGSSYSEEFRSERVPTLEEVLAIGGVDFELEVKGLPNERFVSALIDTIREMGVEHRVEITGFHTVAVPYLRTGLPGARFGLFSPRFETWMSTQLFEDILFESARLGHYDVVHVPASLIARIDVGRLRDAGFTVHCGDAHSPEELASAIRLSDQMSTTDVAAAVMARDAATRRG